MIPALRHRLIELLLGTNLVEDPDFEETIYPLTITGHIQIGDGEHAMEYPNSSAVVNADETLTVVQAGEIVAYYTPMSYTYVATV